MIRTLVEIRNGRVSIQENADETTVTVTVDGAPSSLSDLDVAVGTLGVRENQVRLLKEELEEKATRINALENRVTNLLEDRRLDRQTVKDLTQRLAQQNMEIQQLKEGRTADHEEIEELRRQRDGVMDDLEKVKAGRADEQAELSRFRRAHVCTESCRPNSHVAFTGSQRLKELTAEVERLARQVQEYDRDRKTEQRRADDNKAWAERTEAELERRTGERDEREAARASLERENAWLHRIIRGVNLEVYGPEILEALNQVSRSPEQSEMLATAVRKVRQIVMAPRPETSQA